MTDITTPHEDDIVLRLNDIVDRLLVRPKNARGPWHLPDKYLKKLKGGKND